MAIEDRSIRLVERGEPLIIPESQWQSLGLDESCRELTAHKIIGLRRFGQYRVIEPRQYVGYLRLPGRAIAITPRRADAFGELNRFVSKYPEKRLGAEEDQRRSAEEHALDPSVAFVKAFESAVLVGLPFEYARVTSTTSTPRGRILFSETVRSLTTKGISHKVRCSHGERRYDLRLAGVLRTATSILRDSPLLPSTLQLSMDDMCALLPSSSLELRTQQAIAEAEFLRVEYSDRPELTSLLRCAIAVLEGVGTLFDTAVPIEQGESRFCNVDSLWERACFVAFKEEARNKPGWSVAIHPLGGAGLTLFPAGGPEIDPDVIAYLAGEPRIIVDAKWSEATSASSGDVYQILAYARRLRAATGVLMYLSSGESWFKDVGASEDGVRVYSAGISTLSPVGDMTKIVRQILASH